MSALKVNSIWIIVVNRNECSVQSSRKRGGQSVLNGNRRHQAARALATTRRERILSLVFQAADGCTNEE